MEIVSILSTASITLMGLLGFFLLSSRAGLSANRWLGAFFVLLGFNFLDGTLMLSGYYLDHPYLAFWEEPCIFLLGPVLLFYVKTLIGEIQTIKARQLLHFSPFLIFQLALVFVYHLKSISEKREILLLAMAEKQPLSILLPVMITFFHFFVYTFLARRKIAGHRRRLNHFYSSHDLSWHIRLIDSVLIVFCIAMLSSLVQLLGARASFEITLVIVLITALVFVSGVLFTALKKPVFALQKEAKSKLISGLTVEEESEIKEGAKLAMEQDKIFLNPELTLDDLATHLSVSSRKLSQVINSCFSQNFYEFVNHFRIEEAKRILKESGDSRLTILEVVFQVGYNSKSSFNTQFKKRVGLTPTEYRKSQV